MNARTVLLPVFVILTIGFASIALDESVSKAAATTSTFTHVSTSTATSTLTDVNTQTVTVTTTPPEIYPVTFLVPPSQCYLGALCINATLVDHLGQNLTVILAAWLRNATTGQNVTIIQKGGTSVGYSTCHASPIEPEECLLITYPDTSGTFDVTVYALSADGKTPLSAPVSVGATLP